jgi:hypothetical protein
MLSLIVAASLALSAAAIVTPLEPAPGLDFPSGGQCNIVWSPDTTGTWKTTSIQLMTGSNDAMQHLTTVYTFDGTNAALTTYSWTCPNTTIHSAIYFYQFTSEATFAGTDDVQWTGRFAIGSGPLVDPPNEAGAASWGVGALVGFASTPAPPTAPGGTGVVTPPAGGASDTGTVTTSGAGSGPTASAPTTSGGGAQPTGNNPHAQPGVGANTRTTRDPTATSTSATPQDGVASLRGSVAALVAAGAIAAALL